MLLYSIKKGGSTMLDILANYLMLSIENNLQVNETYLRNLLNFFVRHYHLSNYIKNLEIIYEPYDNKEYLTAEYGLSYIGINLKGILEELNYLFHNDPYYKNLSSYEKNLYQYTCFIEVIAHEVRHARDLRNIHSVKDTLEKKILSPIKWTLPGYEDTPNYSKLFRIYERYYEVCPTERLANFTSLNLCYELLKKVSKSNTVRDEYLLKLLSSLLNPYEINPNPTKYFLEKAHAQTAWKDIAPVIPKLSLEKKLIYGFPIPATYYHKLQEESFKLD